MADAGTGLTPPQRPPPQEAAVSLKVNTMYAHPDRASARATRIPPIYFACPLNDRFTRQKNGLVAAHLCFRRGQRAPGVCDPVVLVADGRIVEFTRVVSFGETMTLDFEPSTYYVRVDLLIAPRVLPARVPLDMEADLARVLAPAQEFKALAAEKSRVLRWAVGIEAQHRRQALTCIEFAHAAAMNCAWPSRELKL